MSSSDKRKARDVLINDEFYGEIVSEARVRGNKSFSQFTNEALRLALSTNGAPLIGIAHAGMPGCCDAEEKRTIYCSELPGGERYAYIEVRGFSMSKIIPHGALALIKKRAAYSNGSIVAVCINHGDGDCFKRVHVLDCVTICLMSDPDPELTDPENYPPICLCAGRDSDDISHTLPDNAVCVDSEEVTVEGVWTGSYIYAARDGN